MCTVEQSSVSNHQIARFYWYINFSLCWLEEGVIQLLGTIESFYIIFVFRDILVQRMTIQVRARNQTQATILTVGIYQIVHQEPLLSLGGVTERMTPPESILMPTQRGAARRLADHKTAHEFGIIETKIGKYF